MLTGLKSLFVAAICPSEANETCPSLPYAISLAAATQAHLSVQAAALKFVLPSAATSATVAGLVAEENRRLAGLAENQGARIRGDAAAAGVACSVETPLLAYGEMSAAILRQSRVHDLTLMECGEDAMEARRGLIETTLFESGRPVLAVPKQCAQFACERIVIAWDGSVMASRAVAGAMPFLRAAGSVEIVSVSGEKDLSRSVPGAELAPHLARHGIEVSVKGLPAGSGDVAETLRNQVHMLRADMIVMGAYKHSRLREWVLGGVTASLLEASPVPMLMSH